MTTKPKAKKFRIRRTGALATDAKRPEARDIQKADPEVEAEAKPAAEPAELGKIEPVKRPETAEEKAARTGEVASASETATESEIDAIRREGLTGRQLRLARRVAQKHNVAATSDFDAVRQLRQRGIDPFQRVNMLELVVPGEQEKNEKGSLKKKDDVKLPQTVAASKDQLPTTETASPMERRFREVSDIQRDIARRRRQKSMSLLLRLAVFVLMPAMVCGYYFYFVATPMYATKSAFLILKADGGGAASPSLLGASPLATAQDAVAVQEYLTSKDAMIRLDEDLGFTSHFSQDWIDPVQRLEEDASIETAHKYFKRNVQIGFDPTEGVIRMEVTAADPQTATVFNERLIQYAEERVDGLSQRKRENQVKDAEQNLEQAEAARRVAQEHLVRMQLENELVDPQAEIAALRGQISTFETQLLEKEIELKALLDNQRPNQAKVDGARGDIERLEATIADLRRQMSSEDEAGRSLADLAAQVQIAQADLATRDLMLSEALAQLSATRREAISQVRYLTTSVVPVPPEDAAYPRKFENTILSFLIFGGIYLMLSLTASILREQVSA